MQALSVTWRRVAKKFHYTSSINMMRNVVKVAFSTKYLLMTNVSISLTLSSIGDTMEQHYEIYTEELQKYDLRRTLHMGFSGAILGVLCHNSYKILDNYIIGKTVGMVTKKLLLDQIIFSPVMIVTFFGCLALFEEDPVVNFKEEVRHKFLSLYKAEWMVWPPAQIINFYFLPTRFRVLYDNVISLGYDVYTSQVKYQKSSKETLKISSS